MNQKIKKIILHIPYIGRILKDRDQLLKERNNLEFQINKNNTSIDIEKILKISNELLYAHIFSDTTSNCQWLKDKSFTPYQGAANYSFLFKLFRIYDIFEPKNILEFGIGQTTKLTSQYIAYKNKSSKAYIIDDNEKWINIYKKLIPITKNLKIIKLDTEKFKYKKTESISSKYSNLKKIIKNTKFNLIIVDGPIGHGKEYPRTNLFDLIKNNLDKDWITIIDDAERHGEQNTINLFEKKLKINKIDFFSFYIEGTKKQQIICSKDVYPIVFAI